jgi:dTDP-4-amino-4,6-dideoxygalactose transaminase
MFVRQPPVWSPLRVRSIVAASGSFAGGDRARGALQGLLAHRFGAEDVVLTGGGTQALQLALALASARAEARGRPIALPAYSCFDLVTAAVGAGVRIRFYDIDPVTLSPDLESLRAVAAEGVAAVVAGNLYGYPVDTAAVGAICDVVEAVFIEDAAQAIGSSTHDGRLAGSLGDASVMSFGRGKGWTGGGGGALLLRGQLAQAWSGVRPGTAAASVELAPAGRGAGRAITSLAAWMLGRPSVYRLPSSIPALGLGETRWRDPVPPAEIPAFSAGLALRTAADAFRGVADRRYTAITLANAMAGSPAAAASVQVCEPLGGSDRAGFLRLPVVARSSLHATGLAERGRDLGIARGYPVALHLLPQARGLHAGSVPRLPGAEQLAEQLVTLPTHRWMTEAHVRALVEMVASIEAT